MTDEEAKKFEEEIDKKRDKIRNMKEEDIVRNAKNHMGNIKPLYKRRKWNWKERRWELVYKTTPPDDYHKRQ